MKKSILFLVLSLVFACKDNKPIVSDSNEALKNTFTDAPIEVKVIDVKITDFNLEILSNGKLQARNKAEIPFEVTERLTKVYVKNGDRVKKGQLLAELDKINALRKLENSKISLNKSIIELQDILLGFGYKIKDTSNVPEKILNNVKIQSNYSKAVADLKEANYDYSKTKIQAPFSGVIANLIATEHNLTSNYKNTLCTLIDDNQMEVVFPVLESEISKIKRGQVIEVFQFSEPDQSHSGKIIEINPVIDSDGMVKIKALVDNTKASFFEGMNIKIKIKNVIPNKIVLPKSAVLLRQDKHVVFVVKNNEAHWVYVEIGQENSSHIVINEGIKAGDMVITSGNSNLAHQTKVQVIE
ncbi:efflux RND transporter periplasmic adaptor subunit [Mariniflexile sp. HMF6888]|uniref:efflux RND transporter periplasmic adaptor subunit n=1 Tax=Mariniflexile sp. HMF6888 TaxID=3373086 RepID=UPI0037A8607C